MSQHPSLRSSDKDKQHRSVLKRHERLKILKEKEKWKEEDSVFGLPKVKIMRFKIKKEKAAAAEAAPGAETAAVPGQEGPPAAAPSKAAPQTKGAPTGKGPAKTPGAGVGKKETK